MRVLIRNGLSDPGFRRNVQMPSSMRRRNREESARKLRQNEDASGGNTGKRIRFQEEGDTYLGDDERERSETTINPDPSVSMSMSFSLPHATDLMMESDMSESFLSDDNILMNVSQMDDTSSKDNNDENDELSSSCRGPVLDNVSEPNAADVAERSAPQESEESNVAEAPANEDEEDQDERTMSSPSLVEPPEVSITAEFEVTEDSTDQEELEVRTTSPANNKNNESLTSASSFLTAPLCHEVSEKFIVSPPLPPTIEPIPSTSAAANMVVQELRVEEIACTHQCKICNRPFKTQYFANAHESTHINYDVEDEVESNVTETESSPGQCDIVAEKSQVAATNDVPVKSPPFLPQILKSRRRLHRHSDQSTLHKQKPLEIDLSLQEGIHFETPPSSPVSHACACDICGKTFSSTRGVNIHKRMHDRICQVCGTKFASVALVNRHKISCPPPQLK